jgi:hypothetical protein
VTIALLLLQADPEPFFNGRDLQGWVGNRDLWRVEEGEIVGTSKGLKRNEFLYRDMKIGDFRLTFEVKLIPDKGNSGVQFRSLPLRSGEMRGYQADIGETWWGKLYEESRRGLLTRKECDAFVNREGWNSYEIVAVGDRVLMALNGRLCVDLVDPKGAREGVIALQLHSGAPEEVRFRKLELQLDPKPVLITLNEY